MNDLPKMVHRSTEVAALKKRYFQDTSIEDIHRRKYVYSDGVTEKEIVLVGKVHLMEAYQGRIYVEQWQDAFDEKGKLKTDDMMEFMAVPISWYITQPDKLSKKDLGMYEFIERYLR